MSSTSSSSSRRVGAKGKIAQVLAQARASVDVNGEYRGHVPGAASLNEPSRPFTPASMDARMTVGDPGLRKSRSGGATGSTISPRPTGREKLNPMTKMAYRRASSDSSVMGSDSNSSAGGSDVTAAAGIDLSPDANPVAEEYTSICRDINCDMAIITARLESSDGSGDLGYINKIAGPVEDLSVFIKKYPELVFGDSNQCMHKLLMWLTSTFNESPIDDVRHVICRYLFRLHISIYNVTMTSAVAETLPIILKDIYFYFKRANSGECDCTPTEQELFQLDLEIILDFLRLIQNTVDVNCANSGFSFVPCEGSSSASSKRRRESNAVPAALSAVSPETMTKLLRCAEYASGCIKEYSQLSKENRRRMLHLDVVTLISHSLQKIVALRDFLDSRYPRLPPNIFSMALRAAEPPEDDLFQKTLKLQICQMEQNAVQMIAALRNFSLDENGREQMLSLQLLPTLCRVTRCSVSRDRTPGSGALSLTQSDDVTSELLLSIARVTAKLSLYENFREQVNQSRPPVHLDSIVQIVLHEASLCDRIMEGDEDVDWPSWHTWPLLSRAAFTLGNFTTTNEPNRLFIAMDCKCLDGLVKLLQTCTISLLSLSDGGDTEGKQQDSDTENEGADTRGAERELADATLKMLRLLANLCIHEVPGNQLAKQSAVLELLQNLLVVSSSSEESEELLLNAIATTTNVCFFACRGCDSRRDVDSKWEELLVGVSVQVTNFLFHDNTEIVAESLRALGNFTRVKSIVQRLCRIRADEAIILLLSHHNPDVAVAAAGVLVNITGFTLFFDDEVRDNFAAETYGAVKISALALTSILRKSSVSDLLFLTLVLQVFYNCLINIKGLKKEKILATSVDTIDELVDVIGAENDERAIESKDDVDPRVDSFKIAAAVVLKEINLLPIVPT